MAEFCEVMRQWQRMCKSMQEKNMSCKEDCLLGHNPTCGELEYASLEEINNAETVIMKWAAENPESVYETWLEFIKRFETGEPKSDKDFIYWMGTTSIPADIAQKLGIEPKEG